MKSGAERSGDLRNHLKPPFLKINRLELSQLKDDIQREIKGLSQASLTEALYKEHQFVNLKMTTT